MRSTRLATLTVIAPVALLLVALLLVATGCNGPPPALTPDPRIDHLEELANDLSRDIGGLSNQVAGLQATPLPTPTAPPAPTLTEIEGLVDHTIAAFLEGLPAVLPKPTAEDVRRAIEERLAAYDEARPTPYPAPTLAEVQGMIDGSISDAIDQLPPAPTPGPTLVEIEEMIDGSISDAIDQLPPAPTPGPTMTEIEGMIEVGVANAIAKLPTVSIVPQASPSSRTTLAGDVALTLHPGTPIAGRDVQFTLEGLQPWANVEVEFIGPRNEPAEWVTADETNYTWTNDMPVTKRVLYADESGKVAWQRVGAKDVEGVWTVRFDIDGVASSVTYPVSQLQLPVQNVETVGLEMRRYQGLVSDTYVSALVPTSFAIDMQAHLRWVVGRLDEAYGLRSTRIPDIFLVGDRTHLARVSQAIGRELGFENGFYRASGPRPGIYLTTNRFRTGLQRVLTHEYVHLVVDELAEGRETPAWLNEGLAEYIENKLGVESERPNATRLLLYRQWDSVQEAHSAGTGLSLTALESQRVWNGRTDENAVSLQYGTAHMAVKYMSEEFSAGAPVEILRQIGRGVSLSRALQDVLDISYGEFRQRSETWTEVWTDPEREEIRGYVERINPIYELVQDQVELRNGSLGGSLRLSQRAAVLRRVVTALADIQADLGAVTPPASLQPLHDRFTGYVNAVAEWLRLERDYTTTTQNAKRIEANAMLPEVNARQASTWRVLNNLQWVYQVGRF